jgi:hypothetical protein
MAGKRPADYSVDQLILATGIADMEAKDSGI